MMTTQGWKTSQKLSLSSDTVYRFRFLNNNYGFSSVFNISFVNGNCSNPIEKIPFTIIGADSSLFNLGIYNQQSFVIGQAERIELLILFKANIQIYSICADNVSPSSSMKQEN